VCEAAVRPPRKANLGSPRTHLRRGPIWEGDLSPNDSTTHVTGNAGTGVTLSDSQVAFNPLFASGNGLGGVSLSKLTFLELDNSKIFYNAGDGLFATSNSLASGQSNTISTNTTWDVEVADDSLVKMIASSVYNLASANNVMNADGSRIELST
jgi:hypothetical protein